MNKLKAIILRNELEDDHIQWIRACEKYIDKVDYRVVNLTADNWLEEIQRQPFNILFAKPGGLTAPFKQLYDERIYILDKVLGYSIFPSPYEIFIYENKRFLSYWLKANNIPHPQTHVFYDLREAVDFTLNIAFPLVAKTNIGSSGSGVIFLQSREEAVRYIRRTFSSHGAPKRKGPNLTKGSWIKRGVHYIFNPADINKKLEIYKADSSDVQTGFVFFQEYVKHDFEWRVVRIGDSFFAHKKLINKKKASGSLKKDYCDPPHELLDFIKTITDKHQFYSQAIDIFETGKGYLVNEMQCIFGQSDTFQMKVNERTGRYRYLNSQWHFEEGMFNGNECYDLRVDYCIGAFNEGNLYQKRK